MSDYQIFSDGACDIALELKEKYHIKTIPFYVSLNGTDYLREIEELPIDEYYNNMIQQHIFPKTSLPSVHDYVNAFTPVLEEGKDIICFTITDTLSGSFQSAATAKIILAETYPDAKIYIINSWLATGAQSLLLLEAGKMQQAGYSIEQVYEISEKLKKTSRILFMVGSLEYLEKGGRIGKLVSLSGSILKIKPLIELKDSEINLAGVTRSRKSGLKKLAQLTGEHFQKHQENPENYSFIIGTTNNWEEVPCFENFLKESVPKGTFLSPFQIGATISAHTGPDTTGICFIKDYRSI